MNIFYLDKDPIIAAQMSCDKHVVKMILESAQMLCSTHRVLDGDEIADSKGMYKMAHKNHPSTIWTRSSVQNYIWLWRHMTALMREYTHRYGKVHATETKLAKIFKNPPKNLPEGPQQEFAVAIAENQTCRQVPGFDKLPVVNKYQQYILNDKPFAVWSKRDKPSWFNK